jgi:DNA-binding MarR family transcriptional regulator
MTRIVDGLERAGLARRRPHPGDRRASIVAATAKGRRLMERGRDRRVDLVTGLLEDLPDDEVDAVDRAAAAIARALEAG